MKAVAALVAAVITAFAVFVVAIFVIADARRDVREGWNLIPVIVFAQDLPAGTVITFDHISQRSLPEQFVTTSWMKPDEVTALVGREINADVVAGDPAAWQLLADQSFARVLDECVRSIREEGAPREAEVAAPDEAANERATTFFAEQSPQ